jgi:ribosome biogenesis GTPase
MSGDDAADVPARVIESFGRRVTVATPDGTSLPAELFGKRLTCVCGDQVTIRPPSRASGDVAKVVTVAPRRTTFARTDSRGRTEPLAANLSLLAVIVAPEPVPDAYIADRYLAGAALAGITGIVVVNKSELAGAEEAAFQTLVREYETAGYEVMRLSARTAGTVAPLTATSAAARYVLD